MQRAHDILVALHGESHHLVAMTEANLGMMHSALGEFDEARRHLDAAIAYHETVDGPDAPSLGTPLSARGDVELVAGNAGAAEPWFERALAVQVKNDMPAPEIALAKFGLAQARAVDATRADEAKQLAEQALAVLVEHEDTHADEVRTWLRSR
jgi:tetratricopeptide (TPR) repeat protein